MVFGAEVWNAELESSLFSDTTPIRRAAGERVKALLKHAKTVRDESPVEAQRLAGTYEWICGNRKRAMKQWEKGIEEADLLGARYALAKIHFERGRRLNDAADLERAEALFIETGAEGQLRELRKLRMPSSQDRP
jgi:hypothetical protein